MAPRLFGFEDCRWPLAFNWVLLITVSWVQVLTYTIGHCALSFSLDNYQLMFNCSFEFVKARQVLDPGSATGLQIFPFAQSHCLFSTHQIHLSLGFSFLLPFVGSFFL
ncbi:hypothetical protein RchiOBHm_Chr2g0094321 [Rosa chinensis]|uniref:Uncharacterized protein n=1 Tax=Rosa chinensis TaxID=74649 RepID=A0A2P6RKG8_ROSCH|nr:hypothetical protein RchiOBHm_Chr2g0094321 [Rosa chinensis]